MINPDFSVSVDDYPQSDFPEFYPDLICEVVAQLNSQLKMAVEEPIPEGATQRQTLQCLKDDLLKHPDLYLTADLLNKISRAQQ